MSTVLIVDFGFSGCRALERQRGKRGEEDRNTRIGYDEILRLRAHFTDAVAGGCCIFRVRSGVSCMPTFFCLQIAYFVLLSPASVRVPGFVSRRHTNC